MPYVEDVQGSRLLVQALQAGGLAMAAFGLWVVGTGELAGMVLVLAAAAPLASARLFGVLRIRVDGRMVRARFGPWGLNIPAVEIEGARVERYPWFSYAGWGLRWGRHGGRFGRACSVPFVRTGVVVDTRTGKRHYLSSRRPLELAAAVNRLAGPDAGGGQAGAPHGREARPSSLSRDQ
ncbi:MAG: hypothetical protein F4150_04810 [Chloroflexi bacterium]|nr:hypothetical protein [Chloroflexota bacterium]